MEAYCTSCKRKKFVENPEYNTIYTKEFHPRKIVKGTCVKCGSGIYQFVKNNNRIQTLLDKVFSFIK